MWYTQITSEYQDNPTEPVEFCAMRPNFYKTKRAAKNGLIKELKEDIEEYFCDYDEEWLNTHMPLDLFKWKLDNNGDKRYGRVKVRSGVNLNDVCKYMEENCSLQLEYNYGECIIR